ncbi:MAG: hypothetical protein GX159_04550, partial [Flavobacteriaceae bacterium]|nr:hypothetical protein [Flavobacteriaceae bacterium]
MDKEFSNSEKVFEKYLDDTLNFQVKKFIEDLKKHYTPYLFSGVLRNFFIKIYEKPRDLDIVLLSSEGKVKENIESFLANYGDVRKNSFGGYKLILDNFPIDLWFIEDTWAFQNKLLNENNNLEYNLLKSTFFNFSSIIYDFKNQTFIIEKDFEKFISKREMDIVLPDNPNQVLCILNIIYYAEKYQINLSKSLINYYISHFNSFSANDYL